MMMMRILQVVKRHVSYLLQNDESTGQQTCSNQVTNLCKVK